MLKSFGAVRFIKTEDKDYATLHRMIEKAGIDLDTNPCVVRETGGQ